MKRVARSGSTVEILNVGNMKIYNYIDAGSFSEWVSINFKVDSGYVYDELIEDDYIEGSLGSIRKYGDVVEGMNKEVQNWFDKFFEEESVTEIQLKY